MSATIRSQVLRSYKDLLRAQRKTFANDQPQVAKAHEYTRQQYRSNAGEHDPATLAKLVKTANQAAVIIRKNVVQGVRKEDALDDHTFRLNIDSEKEINSNDTIRTPNARQPAQRTGTATPTKCCSAP
ncbi:hypothetical protein HKX48_001914 [Thoreauomyces humboldtii]|nr:hypothetical protein HKX48_001914 [Thoreauomyces humboldtii]